MNISKIRGDFPFLHQTHAGRPIVYFDNAATTQKPIQVLRTIETFYSRYNAAVNRSTHEAGNVATDMYRQAHEKVARFIGAESFREIVFTRNSTESINLVCYSLMQNRDKAPGLRANDEIVVPIAEHHSDFVPWLRLRDWLGVAVKFVEISEDGFVHPDAVRAALSGKTRLVCCAHVSNVFGSINPVKEIAAVAHEAGALLLVDGTQSAPHLPVDVQDIGCDFFTFSGHKMLAPLGIGVLFGRKSLLQDMPPFLSGGGMIRSVSRDSVDWNDLPWKFEAGTPDACGAVALGGAIDPVTGERLMGAIDYLEEVGMGAIHNHERDLCNYAIARFRELEGIVTYGPQDAELKCGIVSFNIAKDGNLVHSQIIANFLNDSGILVRSGGHCAYPLFKHIGVEGSVRASFYLYNTREEIDRMTEELAAIISRKLL